MTELTLSKLEKLEGGRFLGWGWKDEECTTKTSGSCSTTTCYKTYTSFWIGVKTKLSKFDVSC